MHELLEAISQVAIGVAGFSGVIVVLQDRDPVADFRLRSLLSLSAEVILFSFLPPLIALITTDEWTIAAVCYAVFHVGQIAWSYFSYRRLGKLAPAQISIDNLLMSIGAVFSVLLFSIALFGPTRLTQFAYTTLLLWALSIAGVQFIRILLQRRNRSDG